MIWWLGYCTLWTESIRYATNCSAYSRLCAMYSMRSISSMLGYRTLVTRSRTASMYASRSLSPFIVASSSPLDQFSQWAEVEIQVVLLELEVLAKLFHLLLEQHEGLAEPLDLLGRKRPALDSPQRLALHQLADQLNEREHQLGKTLLEALAVGVDAPPARGPKAIELVAEELEIAPAGEQPVLELATAICCSGRRHDRGSDGVKLYGGQGPVHTTVAPPTVSSSSSTAARNGPTSSRATR